MAIIGQFRHGDEVLTLVREMYLTGNLALHVVDASGAPYATASVNFPADMLRDAGLVDPDAFYLKDWFENEGLARSLRVSGLIRRADDIEDIASGHITATAYRIVVA